MWETSITHDDLFELSTTGWTGCAAANTRWHVKGDRVTALFLSLYRLRNSWVCTDCTDSGTWVCSGCARCGVRKGSDAGL